MDCAGTGRTDRAPHRGGWLAIVCGLVIALAAGVFLLAGPSARAQIATGPDQGIAGQWDWGAGASGNIVTIWGNGTGRGGEGNTLKWTLVDQIARQYRLEWSNGFTDMATLSVSGNTLLIVNNQGVRFTATRHGGTSSAQPPAPPPAPPPVQPTGGPQPGGAAGVGPLPTGPDQGIAGQWDWGAGASGNIVTIWGNGTGRGGEGNALKWTLVDPIAKQYRLEWSNGFIDMATLSVDGNTLLIVNNEGVRFVSTRHRGTSSANPNPPPPPPPPAGPDGGGQPGDAVAGGPLPTGGQDVFDSTSAKSGDPFNGGSWSNAQNDYAFARRFMMPPVCISGFSLESAGSDVSTRNARIIIELVGPYGARSKILDLRGVAINRGFSPGGSGKVVPPQSASFPPFRTSRIEVQMKGHGWFLMKGLRFSVVRCP